MERRILELIEQIFSDAHVVDIDLSSWDKAIDVYVLADHMPHAEGDRLPLFKVKFMRVRSLRLENAAAPLEGLGIGEHAQWRIDDFRLEEHHGETTVELWGMDPSPRLEIVCQELEIQPFPLSTFDELFPGWTEPRRGLARPGPEEMESQRRAHRKNR